MIPRGILAERRRTTGGGGEFSLAAGASRRACFQNTKAGRVRYLGRTVT